MAEQRTLKSDLFQNYQTYKFVSTARIAAADCPAIGKTYSQLSRLVSTQQTPTVPELRILLKEVDACLEIAIRSDNSCQLVRDTMVDRCNEDFDRTAELIESIATGPDGEDADEQVLALLNVFPAMNSVEYGRCGEAIHNFWNCVAPLDRYPQDSTAFQQLMAIQVFVLRVKEAEQSRIFEAQ